ncbi:MAG: protein-glutamate O-methyltransferase CheR, partial [Alphaproteobacteria bacterium]
MSPEEFGFLRDMLKERSGLIVTEEKQYLLESRLMPLARKEGMQNLSALVAELKSAGAEPLRKAVTEAMTINESFFFRDKTPFENFEKIMLPELLQARAATRKLRIWCAAASTGQEPYSLAMQIRELEAQLGGWDIDILGTDLCAEVLEKAKAGLYSQFEVQRGLPIQLLVKYFKQTGSLWQIDAALRSMVRLQQFNLLDDYRGLGTFDIIFCRNVLIYFDPETKQDMLNRMAQQLQGDGYLVLGAAETVIGITDQFEAVSGARGLYRKSGSAASSAASP